MSDGLDVVSRLRRQAADDARATLLQAHARVEREGARRTGLQRALGVAERALYAQRTALVSAVDVESLRAVEGCMRAHREEIAELTRQLAESTAAYEVARATCARLRGQFSESERDARAVERVQQNAEGARVRQHTLRVEIEHEDAARFHPRG